MKNIIGITFCSGFLFFAAMSAALAGEQSPQAKNSGFGSYFVDAGHPAFSDPEQAPLLAYDSFAPSDLDNIEPAGGPEEKTGTTPSPETSNTETDRPAKK